ncbi:MAG: DUF393 domain-containing protein [Williamsia sp.]|nr:DUF393 domain-containing protein [Williamsia sp.]
MQSLKDHVILYDEECPMCQLYTKAFVKTGMLDKTGRACYQQMPNEVAGCVDRQRAVNEIALVNRKTGEVQYGIRSLFSIIGHAFPVFKRLFNFKPFLWLMSKVYAFVSYNRRVIIPIDTGRLYWPQPAFLLPYRIAYLIFTWVITAWILSHYARLLTGAVPAGGPLREYMVCGGQILFQGIIAGILYRRKAWDYLGNMMTISLAGALLLLPGLLLASFLALSPLFYTAYFLAVAGLMLLEHIRRTRLLNTGWILTGSWVAYRLGVLLIIFYFGKQA